MELSLADAVATVVGDCLEVDQGEEVLVVANPATSGLGAAFREAASERGSDAVLAVIEERASHAGEPPRGVASAMIEADVVIAPTVQSLSHTDARRRASESGTRIATLPGVSPEMLTRLMSDDLGALRRRSDEVAVVLDRGAEARVTCDHGTDLVLDLEGRRAISDGGRLSEPGAFGNLPCGEGFIAPVTAEGVLMVDGTIASVGRVGSPVRLEVRDGYLTKAEGDEGRQLLALLTEHGPEATRIAELGIGTNARAELTGNVLEDEKILGTAHVAFGASAAIGGTVQVPVHLDVVNLRPEVTVDGAPLTLEGGLFAGP